MCLYILTDVKFHLFFINLREIPQKMTSHLSINLRSFLLSLTQFCFIFILEYRRYHIVKVRNIAIPLCITFVKRLIKIMEFISYLIKDLRIIFFSFLKSTIAEF